MGEGMKGDNVSEFFNREGEPIDIDEWTRLLKDRNYSYVAGDQIGNVVVSTVWLGLDHGYDGRRHIFESMIFGGPLDEECERYDSLNEAITGHAAMLKRVKENA